jgi:hypothetical protein
MKWILIFGGCTGFLVGVRLLVESRTLTMQDSNSPLAKTRAGRSLVIGGSVVCYWRDPFCG